VSVADVLAAHGLPAADLGERPASAKRFPDGAAYRVEIPSCEGPRCLEALLATADRLAVRVHRASQGSGVFMLTDAELAEMAAMARGATVEISLFARPNAAWDTSAMARSPAGGAVAAASRGRGRSRLRNVGPQPEPVAAPIRQHPVQHVPERACSRRGGDRSGGVVGLPKCRRGVHGRGRRHHDGDGTGPLPLPAGLSPWCRRRRNQLGGLEVLRS